MDAPVMRRAAAARRPVGQRLVTWALGLLCGLVFVALYAPIILVAVLSFFRLRRGRIQWDSFSMEWYGKLLGNEQIATALANSLLVGFFAVLTSLVVASLLAVYADQHGGRRAAVLQFIVFLPFLLPPIISGLAMLIFFKEIGLPRGLVTVTVGHSVFVLALVYRTILTRLQALNRNLIDASYDLGATRLQTFRYVLLPNLKLTIVTAALLAFALSFDETMITLFLIGDSNTLPVRLYAMMRVGFTPEINALVTLILLFSTVLTLAIARFVGRGDGERFAL